MLEDLDARLRGYFQLRQYSYFFTRKAIKVSSKVPRAPVTMELWFSSSEIISPPLPQSAGRMVELVAVS